MGSHRTTRVVVPDADAGELVWPVDEPRQYPAKNRRPGLRGPRFDGLILKVGYKARGGQIIETRMVEVPTLQGKPESQPHRTEPFLACQTAIPPFGLCPHSGIAAATKNSCVERLIFGPDATGRESGIVRHGPGGGSLRA